MARQQESRGREAERSEYLLRSNSGDESRFQLTTTTVVRETRVGKWVCQRQLEDNNGGGWDGTSNAGDSESESEWLIIEGKD